MELVATVEALGILTEDTEHILVAVNDNNDVLGVSQAVNFQGTWIYNMDLFSSENIVDITFWFYDDNSERIFAVDKDLVFRDGTVSGEATNPIELKAGRILISLSDQGVVTIDILQTNWDLPETVRFTVADASTEDELSSFNDISIMIENDIPALSISSWQTEEGGTFQPIELEEIISDNGTSFDSLTITVQTGNQYSAEITNDYLIVYPPEDTDWNGTEEITLQVSDAHPYDSKTLESTINYVMTPVNDAPVLPQQADLTIEEDEPRTFALEITDIDTGEVFSIFVYSDNDSLVVTADSTDSTITASPAADWYGESNITAIVSDGELTDTTEFTITIDPVNDAPRVAIIEDINIDEDTELLIPLEIVNVDTGETLSVFVSSNVGNVLATASSQESTLKLVPEQNWTGQAQITAIVSDGVLAQSVSFTLTVDPVNDRPTVVDKDDEVINEDSSGTYLFEVADVDTGETLQLFVSSSESNVGVQVNSDDFSITATPSANWHGNADLIVSVSDGELVDTTRFTLTVDPVNDAPIIAEKDNETLLEDFSSSYLFEVADIDTGETLVLSVLSDTSGVEVTVDSDLEHQSINVAPILNWHGKSTITVIVSDGELTDSTDFELTVVPINDAPTIVDVEDKTMLEDNSKTFTFEIADVDTGETLGILVSSSSQDVVVTADSENHSITAVPNENWHGTTEIEVGVTDYDLITTTTFLLTVTPVNDQPHITQFPDITILEDYTETFKLEVSDVDTGEVLTLFATTDNSALTITADSENYTISVVPQDNWHGNSEVEVIVTDDELVFAMSFLLTVDPVNDAPTISSKEDQTILEDQSGTYLFQVADIDTGEVLSISAFSEFVEVELIANSEDYSVTTNPIDDWHGTSEIMVIVSDNALTDTSYFDLIVLPVNDAPIIEPIVDQWMLEDDSKAFYFEINDVDTSEIFTLSSFTDQSNVTVVPNSEDQSITAYAHNDWNGSTNITVIVSDGELTDTTAYNLTIEPANDAPVISDLSDQNILEDELGIYSFEVSDIDDGEDLMLAVFSDRVEIDAVASSEDYTITLIPDLNWNGTSNIGVILSDGLLTDTTYFDLTVFPVNDAPVISQLPNTTFDENSLLSVDLDFSDVDENDILSLTSFSDSDGVTTTLNSSSATLEVTSPDFNGDSEITVIVSDGELMDTTSFIVTIAPTNDAPIITPIENISIQENEEYTLELDLTDIDLNEFLNVSAYSDTADVIVTPNLVTREVVSTNEDSSFFSEENIYSLTYYDSTITIRSTPNWHGFAEVTVVVSDGELTDIETFQIAIGPINDAPTIAAAPDQIMSEDDVQTYSFEVADIDTGTVLNIFAFSDTSSVSVVTNSDDFTVTASPEPDWHGEVEIMVVVSDNYLTDTTTFNLVVDPVNDAPVILPASDQQMLEDNIQSFPFVASDIDTGTVLILTAFSDTSAVILETNSEELTVNADPELNWHGKTEVMLIISDGFLTDTTFFTLTVDPVNDAPIIAQAADVSMPEDIPTNFSFEVSDVDTGSTLILSALSSDEESVIVSANSEDHSITAFPELNWHGQVEITLYISDNELADTTFFTLTVDPLNDAPTIAEVLDQTIFEDQSGTFPMQVADIDTGETLILTALSDQPLILVSTNSEDGTVTTLGTENWHGDANVTVIVSDGELTDTTSFVLTVGPVNNAPIIADIADGSFLENSELTTYLNPDDIDTSETLSLYVFSDTSGVIVSINNDSSYYVVPSEEFHGVAEIPLVLSSPDFYGVSEITVIVSDGFLTDTTSFFVTIAPTNDAPIITPISDQSALENTIFVYELELTDIDTGEVLIINAFSDISDVVVAANSDDSTLTISTTLEWYGTALITVIVSDGELNDLETFVMNFGSVNDAPTISQIPDSFIEENNVFETPIHWADIDTGEVLILTAFADTNAVALDVNTIDSLFTITPDSAWNGTANIKLFVSDGELADSTLFSLTVGPINDAPVITPIADSFIAENSIFELDLELTDIDTGEVLTLSAFADTSAMVVTANSADSSITAIPADDWNGIAQITVVVSDGELTDTVRFLLDVGPLNDAPVIVQVSSISIDEDESYLLPVSFFDVDAQDELTLSAFADTSSLDLFADVDSSSVLIVPEMNWHGSSTISVVVSDGNLNDTTSFMFTADPMNDAPIISEASDAFTVEDSLYIGEYYITDIDTGEVLTISAFSDTSAIEIHIALDSNIISFIPDPDWNGISEITVIVADGELSDTTQFMLTVSNVPDKPYAILQDDINSIQGQVMLIDGSESYDIDDDPLQYYWSIIPEDSLFSLEGIIGDTVVTETAYLEFQSPIRSSEHKFNIKLWVENTSNLFSDEDSLMLTVQTLEANDILPDLSSLLLEAGKAVPITITIPDGFIVDSISINYADAYSGFISNSMIQQEQTGRSGTEYFYEIPFYLAGLEGLAYYVYVEDPYGSIILTDTTDINLAFNDGVVSSGIMHSEFAYGFPRDVWRMISVPSYLDNSQLERILGDAVGSYSESTWMIYDWNSVEGGGEDGSPAGWIQPTQLLPGKAYWLKQVIADAPTFVAPSGKTVELSGYDIEIDPGWNMISSPYLFPVSLEYDLNNFSELYLYGTNISSEPSIDGYLEGWADSTISVMSPWAGYAIYNKTETVQTIQINPLNKNRRQIARSSSGDADWSLKIGVQSSKYFDHKNEFGISRMASNKIDRNDSPEPPVFDKYISFYSSTKNSYGQDKKITTDYRNSDDSLKVWNLVLETNIEEESAQMDIKLNGSIGSEVLWLIDMQNGNTFNIGHDRSISKIVSISTQMVNRYKLVYGNDAEVESLVKAIVALIPKEFSLGHNYPNPFNPSTTIPFTISSPGLAAVTIYDVNGRQIKQIVNENFKPGFYSRVWDGKNSNGIPVSSGVYYYGLRTKTFNSFKKMILIK